MKVGLRLPRLTLTLSSLGGQTVSQLGLPGPQGPQGPAGPLSLLDGPALGNVQGLWFGPTAPPDSSWVWVVTDALPDQPTAVQVAAAVFGFSAPPPSVQLLDAPVGVTVQAVTLDFTAPAPSVVALTGMVSVTAPSVAMDFSAPAPTVQALSGVSFVSDGFRRSYFAGGTVPLFDPAVTYAAGAQCSWHGALYVSLSAGNVGHTPPNGTYWTTAPTTGNMPAYSSGTTYSKHQVVYVGATLWESIADGNVGHTPVDNEGYWLPWQAALVTWNSGAAYPLGAWVTGYYYSLVSNNVGNNPVSSPASWQQDNSAMGAAWAPVPTMSSLIAAIGAQGFVAGANGPAVRVSTSAKTFYAAQYSTVPDEVEGVWETLTIIKVVDGVQTVLSTPINNQWIASARSWALRLSVSGSTLTLKTYDAHGGTLQNTYTATDGAIASGKVGLVGGGGGNYRTDINPGADQFAECYLSSGVTDFYGGEGA